MGIVKDILLVFGGGNWCHRDVFDECKCSCRPSNGKERKVMK